MLRDKKLLLKALRILDGLEVKRALCVEAKLRKEKAASDLEGYSLGGGKLEAEIKGVVAKNA